MTCLPSLSHASRLYLYCVHGNTDHGLFNVEWIISWASVGENFLSAVIIKAVYQASTQKRKKVLNTVFDCDSAAALTPQLPDKFAKCVPIKHDPAACQLSLQDCIISAAGVDLDCQPLSVLPSDRGMGDVKACLHRQIITPRKHAICRVRGWSFHKQTPPGCQGRTSVTCASERMKASLLSLSRAVVFCPVTRAGGALAVSAPPQARPPHTFHQEQIHVCHRARGGSQTEQVSSTNTQTLWVRW